MSNVYEFLNFDQLPAAEVTENGDKITITAPAIPGVGAGQEVVFFARTPLGSGIAIYVPLNQDSLKRPIEVVLDKSQLPNSKELYIDYGAYINKRAVHRSAVRSFPG
ncbi:hypothetical protein [Pseudomonas sp. W4I3]|uniref:hypothetical protein n=1 Tax=Pseudomonas sp. W4I3 TaxID=3042294 RepID=UPI00278AAD48|nr:hypothetical protein [Pseudomonas sp. W4I3]MDQ0740363.1 hypothetical protein [Pseudomonas sp. W4I3]